MGVDEGGNKVFQGDDMQKPCAGAKVDQFKPTNRFDVVKQGVNEGKGGK